MPQPIALLLAHLCLSTVQAATLRWSSQGDLATTHPHGQNETLNNGASRSSPRNPACRARSTTTRFEVTTCQTAS